MSPPLTLAGLPGFPVGLQLVASSTECLQILQQIRPALGLRNDVVGVGLLAVDDGPAPAALVVVSQEALSPRQHPTTPAVTSGVSGWAGILPGLFLGSVDPGWPKDRDAIRHQPFIVTVATTPVLFVVLLASFTHCAANAASGRAYAFPTAVLGCKVMFAGDPTLSCS